MLTFNKNSWHHKLYCSFHSQNMHSEYYTPPSDFCAYVRNIVLILFLCTVMASVSLVVVVSLALPILYLTDTLLGLFPWTMGEGVQIFFSVGVILWAVGASLFGLYQLRVWLYNRRYAKYRAIEDRENNPNYKAPEPGLFTEWYRAFKGKVCPTMSFN